MERRNFAGLLFQALLVVCVIAVSSTTWAAIDTWTGNGDGFWATANDWNPAATPAAGDSLVFTSALGSFGSANITDNNNVSFTGITFNTGAAAYNISAASPVTTLAFTGALTDNSANGNAEVFNLGLAGATTSSLVFGSDSSGNNAVTLGATSTVGSIVVGTLNSASANVLSIGAGNTLNVTGATGVQVMSFNAAAATATSASLTISGVGSTLNMTTTTNSSFIIGTDNATNETTAKVDMSGLSNFIYSTGATGTGTMTAGFDGKITATLTLANNTNSITAATFSIGDSNGKNGLTSTLNLNGTTAVNAGTVTFGASKGTGNVSFLAGAPVGSSVTPALKIRGQNGTARVTNINLGTGTSGSGAGSTTTNLTGHYVDILGTTMTLALHGNAGTGSNTSSFSFDNGIVDVTSLVIANRSGTGTGNATATFTVGSAGDSNTATLNVGATGITIAANSDAASGTSTGTFILKTGAAVNLGGNISKTVGASISPGTANIILDGGTLNMGGFAIGSAALPIDNLGLTAAGETATISNLGGTGVNGAGLTLNNSSFAVNGGATINYGLGTLILGGANTYSGGTNINSGTLLVNGTLAANGTDIVTVNSGLLGGTGTMNQAVTLSNGTLTGGTGATGPTGATGTLNLAGGLTVNNGTLSFNLGTTTSNSLNITGSATFNGGSLALLLTGSPTNGQTYNVITGNSPLTGSALAGFLNPVTIGRTILTPSLTVGGDDLTVTVSGGPATIVWNNAGGSPADGQTWDVQTNQNWNSGLPGGSGGTHSHDLFFTNDNVVFNDNNNATSNGGTNPNAYTVTVATGGVSPGSVTVNNSLGNYTIGGDVIAGNGTLSKSGSGALTLSSANTYSGGTTLTQGTLNINNGGSSSSSSIGTGKLTLAGGTINNTSGSPVVLQSNNAQSWAGSFSYAGSNVDNTHDLNLGTGTVSLDGANITLTLGGSASTLTVGGIIQNGTSGNGFAVSGTGTLVLSGASTYSGNTAINSGVLVKVAGVNFTNQLGVGGVVNIAAGGTLDIGGITTNNSAGGFGAKQFNIAGNGVGGVGALYNSGTQQQNAFQRVALTADASVGGSNAGGTAGRLDLRGGTPVLDLAGHTLTKNGANLFTLVGATVNSTGGTPGAIVVNSGELGLETNSVVGPTAVSSITLNGNSFLELFNDTAATSTITAPVIVAGSGVVIGAGNNVANNIGSPITLQNSVTFEPLTNNAVAPASNFQMIVSGNITDNNGGFSINKIGGSTDVTTLSGTNSWTGGTNIKSGILKLGSNGALPTAGTVVNFGASGTNGTLDLGGFNGNVGGLVDANAGGTGNIIGNSSTTTNSTLNYVTGTSSFDGEIQDTIGTGTKTVALSVTGGLLTLNASNNYSGGTTVSGTGTLQIGTGQSSALGSTSGSLTVNTGGTLDLNGNNATVGALSGTGGSITNTNSNSPQLAVGTAANSTFAGVISNGTAGGTTSLLKQNGGTLTLSGVNTYTGDTNVNQGTLNVTGKLAAAGNVNVNSTATLSGDGNGTTTGVVGKVNLGGGTVNPGTTAGAIGTLGMASLQGGGTLHFDVGSSGNNDKLVVSGAADISSATIAPVPTNSPFYFTPGSYTLLTSSSLSGTGTFQPPLARQTANLDFSTPNTVKLNVTDAGQSATLTWNNNPGGGDGQTWDVAGNRNWTSSATILDPDKFYSGDNVIFNDSNNFPTNSNAFNVNISGNVNPSSVTVNTTHTYTIGGGSIIGSGSLTKSGTGTLVLNTSSSTYSGGTFVLNGTLQAGSSGAFSPNSAITLGDGSANTSGVLDLNGNTISVGGLTTAGTGNGNIVGNSSITSSAGLNFTGGTSSFGGIIQDSVNGGTQSTSLTVASGTLKLAGNSTYTGGTTINAGATLQLGDNTAAGSVVGNINDNGALAYGHTNPVTVADGIINGSGQLIQNGSGTVTLGSEGYSGQTILNAGTLALTSDNSINNATGGIAFNGGALQFNNYASALPAAPFNNAGNVKLGASGSPDASSSGVTANIIANGGSTLSSTTVIAGTSSLTFVGPGTLEILATNTYTGNTSISGGTLVASTSASLGSTTSGVVNISGGTLDLSGNATANNLNFGTKQFNIAGNGSDGQGAIVNNSALTQQNAFGKITLTADASVGGSSAGGNAGRFDMRSSTPVLDLAGHKLTKLGGNQFTLVATQINSTGGVPGSIEVAAGELGLETTTVMAPSAVSSLTLDANTRLEFFSNTATTSTITSPIIVAGSGVFIGPNGTAPIIGSPITLQADVNFEGINTNAPLATDATNLTLTGNITESGGSHGIIKLGVNTLTLNGINTYSGITTVNQGTLQLGVANSTPNTSQLVLGGGTLATSGLNQTMTSANLLLNNSVTSTIDFGTGASILKFADSSAQTWTGTLTINNWNGTTVTGGGADELFVGTSGTGLTSTQLADINFTGFGTGASILSNGEVVPFFAGGPLKGDINQDGHVDVQDIAALMKALTDIGSSGTTDTNSYAFQHPTLSNTQIASILDVNGDGLDNNADIQGLINYLLAGNGSTSPVPEPTSLVLLGVGGALLLAKRARRKSMQA